MVVTFANTISRSTMTDPFDEGSFSCAPNDAQVFVAPWNMCNEVNPPSTVVLHDKLSELCHLARQHRRCPLEIDEIDRGPSGTSKMAPHRRYIGAILKRGLDKASQVSAPNTNCCGTHENVRGPDYYNQETNE